MKPSLKIFFFALLLLLPFGLTLATPKKTSPGPFASKLPDFSLKDPAGKTFTKKDVLKNGVVLVVTAPILKNKKAQEGWSDFLTEAKSGSKAKLVMLEDMEPSDFRKKALKRMKEEYRPGKEPILLIDERGELRKKLKVERKETVVLVYDEDGKLLHAEKNEPTAAAAKKMWGLLSKKGLFSLHEKRDQPGKPST